MSPTPDSASQTGPMWTKKGQGDQRAARKTTWERQSHSPQSHKLERTSLKSLTGPRNREMSFTSKGTILGRTRVLRTQSWGDRPTWCFSFSSLAWRWTCWKLVRNSPFEWSEGACAGGGGRPGGQRTCPRSPVTTGKPLEGCPGAGSLKGISSRMSEACMQSPHEAALVRSGRSPSVVQVQPPVRRALGHTDVRATTTLQQARPGVPLLSSQLTGRQALGRTPYRLVSML